MTTSIILGYTNRSTVAIFINIKTSKGNFLCYEDTEGFSEYSPAWIEAEITNGMVSSKDAMFMLGMLFSAGFKNVHIESQLGGAYFAEKCVKPLKY